MMDKLEALCRAWIECDPNRAGHQRGSGFHPDDLMPEHETQVVKNDKGLPIGVTQGGVSEDLQGRPRWVWFTPRAVALEEYLEKHGYAIVSREQVFAWMPSSTAPKDGTQILGAYWNDVSWEFRVVWWSNDDANYPWQGDGNSWPEERIDYWKELSPPAKVNA